jgi:hypothetical protein
MRSHGRILQGQQTAKCTQQRIRTRVTDWVHEVCAGSMQTLAVGQDGDVIGFGSNAVFRQLVFPTSRRQCRFQRKVPTGDDSEDDLGRATGSGGGLVRLEQSDSLSVVPPTFKLELFTVPFAENE